MSKRITVILSDKAEKYFNEVKSSLDRGDGSVATNNDVINEIMETNADFERLEGQSVCGWIGDNYPLYYKEQSEG